ncbi:hypothetical protein D2V93_10100 [Flagellimonas taeanensis]|nr:hypothetical protein D2V93_10100 [Allomuricauda taeanensis]
MIKLIKQPFLLYLYSFGVPKKQRGREIIPWSGRKLQIIDQKLWGWYGQSFRVNLRSSTMTNTKKRLLLPHAKKE